MSCAQLIRAHSGARYARSGGAQLIGTVVFGLRLRLRDHAGRATGGGGAETRRCGDTVARTRDAGSMRGQRGVRGARGSGFGAKTGFFATVAAAGSGARTAAMLGHGDM